MEEKLNIIYEKILDLEIEIKEIKSQKRMQELESEKEEIEDKIGHLEHIKKVRNEIKAELMSSFRSIKMEK